MTRRLLAGAWLAAQALLPLPAQALLPVRAADAPLHTAQAASSAASDRAQAAFDAQRAWTEFTELLRLDYSYFERPGVDGPKVLERFAAQARASTSRGEFVALAKTVARNFADPHFNVGPSAPGDPALVPTASDLAADWVNGRARIRAVRAGSDAAARRVPIGATVVAIDGLAPSARVEVLLGQPVSALSGVQMRYGLNLALAGVRGQPRQLVLRDAAGAARTIDLKPTAELADTVAAAPAVVSERRGPVGLIRLENSLGRDATIAQFAAAVHALRDTRALVVDLRNTPSGGNTAVARAIMGHFVGTERPYQVHVVTGEQTRLGVQRKFIELVAPLAPRYRGRVFVLGGRWTGSMGEGMMIGFDAIGHRTVGSELGHLLGALFSETLPTSGARVELGQERLLHANGMPREAFLPAIRVDPAEATNDRDPALDAVWRALGLGPAPSAHPR